MSFLRIVADAEEAVEECGLILWKKFHEYRPGRDSVGWACQVARCQALKSLQRRARGRQLFGGVFLAMFAVATDEEALARLALRQEALAERIPRLEAAERDLVCRRCRKGATTWDVAETRKGSAQGSRRSAHRIRAALAMCVGRRLAGEQDE